MALLWEAWSRSGRCGLRPWGCSSAGRRQRTRRRRRSHQGRWRPYHKLPSIIPARKKWKIDLVNAQLCRYPAIEFLSRLWWVSSYTSFCPADYRHALTPEHDACAATQQENTIYWVHDSSVDVRNSLLVLRPLGFTFTRTAPLTSYIFFAIGY